MKLAPNKPKAEAYINFCMLALSTALGLLVFNWLLTIASKAISQKNSFPRTLLNYFDPVARWKYPDFQNQKENRSSIYLVGDSYAEGAGDLFLENEYAYSAGHFLRPLISNKQNIRLAANSGSDLPKQLNLLQKKLEGKLNPLASANPENQSINFILFFYEGNDLENVAISKDYAFEKNSFARRRLPIVHAYNRIHSEILHRARKIKYHAMGETEANNKASTINKLCVKAQCRVMPPLQSAAAGLSKSQIDDSIAYTMSRIIDFKSKYPYSDFCLVYVPSPATIYQPKEFFYENYFGKEQVKSTFAENDQRSKRIRSLMSLAADNSEITFADPTKELQELATTRFIHGKIDALHFNKHGYQKLARLTADKCNY